MNIYTAEMKMSFKSLIYWTLGLSLIVIIFMNLYPAISESAESLENVMSNFPEEIRSALNLSDFKLNELLGFYCYLFTYILLTGSIYSMKLGVSVLSEEIRSKTADFLNTKPVSRTSIVSSKILCVFTNLLIQNLIYFIVSFITINLYKNNDEFSFKTFFLINLSLFLVQLFFMSFGLFISIILRKIKTVMPITLGVVFFFFILQMINETLKNKELSYITPFAYFDLSKVIEKVRFETNYLIINIVFIIVFTTITYIVYQKKDIPSL
jgi:ABC-2 type transport system permease protein